MTNRNSLSQWQQANELFEKYIEKPIEESVLLLESDKNISQEVKVLVSRLLKSYSSQSTTLEQADLSFFDSLNEQTLNLAGTNIGDYQLISLIGEGGMAKVYKAERTNTTIQKYVAVKILNKKRKLNKTLESLFEKEQTTLSKLTHLNIIAFHHGGITTHGAPYLVMEYIENAENIALFCQKNKLKTKQIIKLILPIIDAIGYAHQQLVVHKDIKPSNILIDSQGKPHLLDFGISSISDQINNEDTPHIYTPDYASPEQYLKRKITTASDIFSVTATILDLITGKKRTTSTARQHYDYSNDRDDIAKILNASKLDKDLKNIIKKGLKEKPDNRYQSAQELKVDLQNYLKSEPVSATAHSSFYLLSKFLKRNPLSSIFVTALLCAIIFSLAAMFTQKNKAIFEAKKAKQVSDFLIESFQASDPDLTKGTEISVIELLNNAKVKIYESSLNDDYLTSSLEQNIGAALAKIGQYQEAEKLLLKAILSNNDNFNARLALSSLYLKQKDNEKSHQQYDYLFDKRSKLSSVQKHDLQQINANQLLFDGDFDKAIEAISKTFIHGDITTKQRIKSHLILAEILNKKGDSTKAVLELEKTLKMSNKANGEFSTTSTTISNLLADSLTNINPIPYDKLIKIYQQTIASQVKLYGNKHPLVAKTYLQYGFALKAINKAKKANEIANKAKIIALDNFGNNHILSAHIDLLISQLELAENKLEKAIETLKHVVKVYEKTYGLNHFETNQVKTTMALYMIKANQGEQAVVTLKSLYTSQKQQLGENHQATFYVVLNLTKAYNMIGDYKTAIDIGKDALFKSQKHLGKEFVITIGIQAILGKSFLKSEQATMAINTLKPLLSLPQVTSNSTYNKKIAILLIQSYIKNQQLSDAQALIEQLINSYYQQPDKFDKTYEELSKLKQSLKDTSVN